MFRRVDGTGAALADGVVIVIDVIRAFTVADYSLNDSAKDQASSIYKASILISRWWEQFTQLKKTDPKDT